MRTDRLGRRTDGRADRRTDRPMWGRTDGKTDGKAAAKSQNARMAGSFDSLGCDKYYNAANPFEWMEMISLQGKTNFFEKRVGEYAKSGVGVSSEEQVFSIDADF